MSSLTKNTAKQQGMCRAQQMPSTQAQQFWELGIITLVCLCIRHTPGVHLLVLSHLQGIPSCVSSLQCDQRGEGVKFPSEELKGRWWRRGTFFLTLTLIPSQTVTPLLGLDLSFTFPAGWDWEHFTHLPHGKCLASSQDSYVN